MKYPVPQDFEQYQLPQDFVSGGFFDQEIQTNQLLLGQFKEIVKKWQPIFSHLPGIKAVYICNSLSFDAVHSDSDIDLFIVTQNNRLWIARFFSVIIFQILNIRGYKNNKFKKFCLSFYVTENNSNLYEISLKPYDIYLVYWLTNLIQIYGDFDILSQNNWYKPILPDFDKKKTWIENNIRNSKIKFLAQKILDTKIGDFIEILIKSSRMPIMKYKYKKQGSPWGVIIGDDILKFHGNDIRKNINFLSSFGKKHQN